MSPVRVNSVTFGVTRSRKRTLLKYFLGFFFIMINSIAKKYIGKTMMNKEVIELNTISVGLFHPR